MCGISGYFFHKEILDQSSVSLEKASSKIEHRGPDDSGIFYDFEKVVGLAHQRLSIIDTSCPSNINLSTKLLPINPAPPTTTYFIF